MRSCWKTLPLVRRGNHRLAPCRDHADCGRDAHDESSVADAREQLAALARDTSIATPLELALELGEGTASPETIAWATRRVLERLSEERRVVVVLDDLHWAEDALLDLVEHVAGHGRDASCWSGWPGRSCSRAGLSGRGRSCASRRSRRARSTPSLPRSVSLRRSSRGCATPRAATPSSSRSWLQCTPDDSWRRGPRDARGAPLLGARLDRLGRPRARGRGARLGRGAGLPPGRRWRRSRWRRSCPGCNRATHGA